MNKVAGDTAMDAIDYKDTMTAIQITHKAWNSAMDVTNHTILLPTKPGTMVVMNTICSYTGAAPFNETWPKKG